jgi:hypothetical protein
MLTELPDKPPATLEGMQALMDEYDAAVVHLKAQIQWAIDNDMLVLAHAYTEGLRRTLVTAVATGEALQALL